MLRSTGGRRTDIVIRSSPSLTGQFRIVRDEVAWSHGGTLRVLEQILARRLNLVTCSVIDDLRMLVRSVYVQGTRETRATRHALFQHSPSIRVYNWSLYTKNIFK
jgi:hypothetical protein